LIRVAITGPEASGKSELTKELANEFNTSYAPEFARSYLKQKNGLYTFEDLDRIASGQLANEKLALIKAKEICFFDTDMLVMYIWSSFRFNKVSPLISQALLNSQYDFWFLCKPDLPWEKDVLRESPDQAERDELYEIYYKYLVQNQPNKFSIIEGYGNERIEQALSIIDGIL